MGLDGASIQRYDGWSALYCRGAPVGSEAPGGRALWCRRRPAALAAPRRAALVTSRALRGVFWHVSAWHRRQEARLPCLRPRACGRARQARRRSARVFELAARDEPAWLVARREGSKVMLLLLRKAPKASNKRLVMSPRLRCAPSHCVFHRHVRRIRVRGLYGRGLHWCGAFFLRLFSRSPGGR